MFAIKKIFILAVALYFSVFANVSASTTPNPFTDPNSFDNSGAAGATAGSPYNSSGDAGATAGTPFNSNGTDALTSQNNNGYTNKSVTGESIENPGSCDTNLDTFGDFLGFGTCLINRFLLPILIVLALVIFFFGVVQYVLNGESTEERAKGRQFMLWGVLALFVLVSIWGIIKLLSVTFGFGVSSIIPQFK